MKKVLITGGLGFMGSHMAELCVRQGHEVTLLDCSEKNIGNIASFRNKVKLLAMDIKDIGEEVKGFDIIFHMLGTSDNYALVEGEPYRDLELNCTATIALLEAMKKHNPKARLLYASTFLVNGDVEKMPVSTDSPCNPNGMCGATRLAGEHFCRIYGRVFGLDTVVARLTNVFGERRAGNTKKAGLNYLIWQAVNGQVLSVYDNGEFYRDYIHAGDAASACLAIALKGKGGQTYYVGRGERTKFGNLVGMIVKQTGAKTKSIAPPDFHKRVGMRDFVCDNSELKKLGWSPKVELEEGIRRTVAYYRKTKKK